MKKASIRALALLLCAVLLCGAGGALTATADSVSDLQQQIQQLEKEAAGYRDKLNASNQDLQSATERKEYYDKQIAAVSQQIDLLEDAINQLNSEISVKNQHIDQAEEELAATNEALEERYRQTQERVRALAKTGNVTLLQMLLDTGSYTDYLLKSKAMSCLAENDQALMDEMERELSGISERKAALEEEKAALEEEKATTAALKQQSDAKKAELDSLCNARKAEIAQLEQNMAYYQTKIQDIERSEKEIDAQIEALLKQETTVSGEITIPFAWPVPNLTTITSVFGPRNPIPGLNTSSIHRGYDIAGPGAYGSKIYAAESGKVVTATYHWSYGNYVIVDHGYDGQGRRVMTWYAHMSSIKVSVGDTVVRGSTVLGLVGSTGQADGPHLHFEVRIDGTAVDSIKQGYLVKP